MYIGFMGFIGFMGVRGFRVCTLNVCTPKLWVPNTLIEGHIPWFRDPKPKGTNPKGPKENSLIHRDTGKENGNPRSLQRGIEGFKRVYMGVILGYQVLEIALRYLKYLETQYSILVVEFLPDFGY